MKQVMIRMKTGEIGNRGRSRPQEQEAVQDSGAARAGAIDEMFGTEI